MIAAAGPLTAQDVDSVAGKRVVFLGDQLVLCSLSLLTTKGPRLAQALEAGWDLLIVDEAQEILSINLPALTSLAAGLTLKDMISLQNVTLNLPRTAYQAKGSDSELFRIIAERMEVAAKAHIQKRYFIERLLSFGESGPLALLTWRFAAAALTMVSSPADQPISRSADLVPAGPRSGPRGRTATGARSSARVRPRGDR